MKVEYKQVPLLSLLVFPAVIVSVWLGAGGHAPVLLYLPYALLFGPLALIGFFLKIKGTTADVLFYLVSPYLLYSVYGFIFVFLSRRSRTGCRLFIATIVTIHILSGIIFLYIGN